MSQRSKKVDLPNILFLVTGAVLVFAIYAVKLYKWEHKEGDQSPGSHDGHSSFISRTPDTQP